MTRSGSAAENNARRGTGAHRVVLAVLLLLFGLKAFTSLRQDSATWDETHYFGLGKYLLETGRWDVPGSILHPPLSFYLHSLPLLFVELEASAWKSDRSRLDDRLYLASMDVERGQALLSSPANRDDRLLTMARLMMVATALALACFVYAWSDRLYGGASAVAAAVLFAFCPNILAHARLITPDITVTAFTFIASYGFWRLLRRGRWIDGLLGGLAFGLALLSKFTAVLLIPTHVVLIVLCLATRRRVPWRGCLVFAATGVALLLLGYGLQIDAYLEGFAFQQQHASEGHSGFLLGERSTKGWWHYFLVAFVLKTPVGFLLLLAVAGTTWLRGRKPHGFDEAFLLVPVLVVGGFFALNPQSIGLRYVLPIYPFLFVFASRALAEMRSGLRLALCIALLAWHVGVSSWIHPHYLAYFNELAGGPARGYERLVDSNLDWGQGLKELKRYMDEHGIARVRLSYFGSDAPERYGIAYDWLPSYVLRKPDPGPRELAPSPWVAISATNLQGVYFEDQDLFASFRERAPDAVIGYSIFLYHLPRRE